jgi:hypothetical protein
MFTMANNWLKPKVLAGGGYSITYAMKVDKVEKRDRNENNKQ